MKIYSKMVSIPIGIASNLFNGTVLKYIIKNNKKRAEMIFTIVFILLLST